MNVYKVMRNFEEKIVGLKRTVVISSDVKAEDASV